ncbi:hypothetical protein KI387_024232, partial [Taxus chinensis]
MSQTIWDKNSRTARNGLPCPSSAGDTCHDLIGPRVSRLSVPHASICPNCPSAEVPRFGRTGRFASFTYICSNCPGLSGTNSSKPPEMGFLCSRSLRLFTSFTSFASSRPRCPDYLVRKFSFGRTDFLRPVRFDGPIVLVLQFLISAEPA